MYAESYVRQMEQTGLTAIIDEAGTDMNDTPIAHSSRSRVPAGGISRRICELAVDRAALSPPEAMERDEDGTAFDAVLRQAMSADERVLMRLVSVLLDDAWRFGTGKALRGELRRLFTSGGRSDRRFYAAFHGIERRVWKCQ